MLGVITIAMGTSSDRSASTASSRSSLSPPLATITGSTTRASRLYCLAFAATISIMVELESIPVFTTSAPMSVITASICDSMSDAGSSSTSVTPLVFWEVMAVSAEVP